MNSNKDKKVPAKEKTLLQKIEQIIESGEPYREGMKEKNVPQRYDPQTERDVLKLVYEYANMAAKHDPCHNDEELANRIGDYMEYCKTKGEYATVEHLALWTGWGYAQFHKIEVGESPGFSPMTREILHRAKEWVAAADAQLVIMGKEPFLAYCFRSKNFYGMQDKTEVVVFDDSRDAGRLTAEQVRAKWLGKAPDLDMLGDGSTEKEENS